jgi:predicted HicB family RNase H-like nuclease
LLVSIPNQWARKETLLDPNQTRHPPQFPLRLARSLKQAADLMAKQQGISLNHFISLAVAEKINRIENQAESSANSDAQS